MSEPLLPKAPEDDMLALQLHAEEISIERHRLETGRVKLQVRTTSQDHLVDEELTHERVQIERVAIGRVVDVAPPDRQEGDTTVISVVEEILVVERRLVLKEEVRLTRIRVAGRHRETVSLRTQEATVNRVPIESAETHLSSVAQPTIRD